MVRARDLPPLRLRRVRTTDLPLLVRHRTAMWKDIGGFTPDALRRDASAYRRWVRQRLRARRLLGWIAEAEDGRAAGSGCVWIVESQPHPGEPNLWRPYLLSMYTAAAFRGRGVASSIVREAVEWARARGYSRITLHGAKMGRPVYARLGFERTWEMRKMLKRRRARGPTRRGTSGPARRTSGRRVLSR